MSGPAARWLADGRRLHLQHGPIDLVIDAEGPGRVPALRAAHDRFQTVLSEIVPELAALRTPPGNPPEGAIARRMHAATLPHAVHCFVTPMAAVAGSVADEVLSAMRAAGQLTRAMVNNGGDIALHLGKGARYRAGIAGLDGKAHGVIDLTADSPVRGIATSGLGGRSLSLGIAESVTVLARDAAAADVAVTLIANAVDLPGHPAITRTPAITLDPDSDLGTRPVVIGCDALSEAEIAQALDSGASVAGRILHDGLILGAALVLRGQLRAVNLPLIAAQPQQGTPEHV